MSGTLDILGKLAPLFVLLGTIITVAGGIIVRRVQSQIESRTANISAEKELRDDLLELVEKHEQRIESCEKRLEQRDTKINTLQSENDTLRIENITLKLRIVDLENKVKELSARLAEFTNKVYYTGDKNNNV